MRTRTKCWRIAEAEKVGLYGRHIELYIYVDYFDDGTTMTSYKILHCYYNCARGWYTKHFDTKDLETMYAEWQRLLDKYKFDSVYFWNLDRAVEHNIDIKKIR